MDLCPICKINIESTLHIFYGCAPCFIYLPFHVALQKNIIFHCCLAADSLAGVCYILKYLFVADEIWMARNCLNQDPSYEFDIDGIAASISCIFKLCAGVLKLDNYAPHSLNLIGNTNPYSSASQYNLCPVLSFIDGNFSYSLSACDLAFYNARGSFLYSVKNFYHILFIKLYVIFIYIRPLIEQVISILTFGSVRDGKEGTIIKL